MELTSLCSPKQMFPIYSPSWIHSSGALQSNSVLSKISSGRKLGKVGVGCLPLSEEVLKLSRALELLSVMGIRSCQVCVCVCVCV